MKTNHFPHILAIIGNDSSGPFSHIAGHIYSYSKISTQQRVQVTTAVCKQMNDILVTRLSVLTQYNPVLSCNCMLSTAINTCNNVLFRYCCMVP